MDSKVEARDMTVDFASTPRLLVYKGRVRIIGSAGLSSHVQLLSLVPAAQPFAPSDT